MMRVHLPTKSQVISRYRHFAGRLDAATLTSLQILISTNKTTNCAHQLWKRLIHGSVQDANQSQKEECGLKAHYQKQLDHQNQCNLLALLFTHTVLMMTM